MEGDLIIMRIKVKEVTPAEARCGVGPCPAVFKTDRGTFIIVGSTLANDGLPLAVRRKIGEGEVAVEVPEQVLPLCT